MIRNQILIQASQYIGKEVSVKLMDLGAARLADDTDNVIDIVLKPGYSPEEQ